MFRSKQQTFNRDLYSWKGGKGERERIWGHLTERDKNRDGLQLRKRRTQSKVVEDPYSGKYVPMEANKKGFKELSLDTYSKTQENMDI